MFCLSGKGSILSCDVFPPFDASDGLHAVGLIDLSTFNSIPNIEKGKNDKFYYGEHIITIEEGTYEIESIANYLIENLKDGVVLSLKANNSTLKSEIKCTVEIDFSHKDSIGELLGFSSKKLEANKKHVSDKTVNIIKVNVIRVECNIVKGSYDNGRESHLLYEFFPDVEAGYKLIQVPSPIVYLPLNVQRVDNITVSLRDQDGDLINFRDEVVSLRLHIKKVNGTGI